MRTLASLTHYLVTADADGLQIQQYADGNVLVERDGAGWMGVDPTLGRPAGEDRGAGHAEPDDADVLRRLAARGLLERDDLVPDGLLPAAVRLRPRQADEPRLVQAMGPVLEELQPLLALRFLVVGLAPPLRDVGLEPGTQARAELGLFGGVAEVHPHRIVLRSE